MTNLHTKFLLPLAALALVSAACDPFPEAPGGDPAVVRVITYNGSLGTSTTVETVTGGNTVATDSAEPDSVIRVQFNKPMDGSSIQLYPNYDANGAPFVPPGGADPCTPAAGLVLTNFDAATLVCYDPASATDGASLVVYPGAPLLYGTVYTIGGTVRDYEGKGITINVTVTVDARPLPFGVDGYTAGVDWFDSGTATTYDVLVSDNAAGPFVPLATGLLPVDVCDAGLCEFVHSELAPRTEYYYQVKEGTVARPASTGPASTLGALTPTLGVTSTTTVPPLILTGIIRVGWGAIVGANGYDVEQSVDGGTTWTLLYHYAAALAPNPARVVYPGSAAADPRIVPTANGTLTSGNSYTFRVTPTFASGYVAAKGNMASKVAP